MRLWSLHPQYLDVKGLLAVWREGLLAQAVLKGATKGYKNHPQLTRFKAQTNPAETVGQYLQSIYLEAKNRQYSFDANRILQPRIRPTPISVTQGQIAYEWQHLLQKLEQRDPDRWKSLQQIEQPKPHPLFSIIPGDVEDWERVATDYTPPQPIHYPLEH